MVTQSMMSSDIIIVTAFEGRQLSLVAVHSGGKERLHSWATHNKNGKKANVRNSVKTKNLIRNMHSFRGSLYMCQYKCDTKGYLGGVSPIGKALTIVRSAPPARKEKEINTA